MMWSKRFLANRTRSERSSPFALCVSMFCPFLHCCRLCAAPRSKKWIHVQILNPNCLFFLWRNNPWFLVQIHFTYCNHVYIEPRCRRKSMFDYRHVHQLHMHHIRLQHIQVRLQLLSTMSTLRWDYQIHITFLDLIMFVHRVVSLFSITTIDQYIIHNLHTMRIIYNR